MELRLTLEGGAGLGRRLTKWSSGDRCHSGGFLLRIMPPSWQPVPACTRNGHSAGGPFINAATNAAGGPFNTATTGFSRRAILLAATTAAGGTAILCNEENWNRTRHRCDNDCAGELFYLPERWHCSDSRFQAQNWQSLQQKGQNKGNPCIDSRFQAQTCESMQPRGKN